MTAHDRINAVIRAWRRGGPVPSFHAQAQRDLRRTWPVLARALDALPSGTGPTDIRQPKTGVRQEPTWVFTCPVESCHLYEAGFTDQTDADNALYEHIDERHN